MEKCDFPMEKMKVFLVTPVLPTEVTYRKSDELRQLTVT